MRTLAEKHNCKFKRGFDYDIVTCENGQDRETKKQTIKKLEDEIYSKGNYISIRNMGTSLMLFKR